MDFKANISYVRVAPRKMGALADMIRGMGVNQALDSLKLCPKRNAADILYKLIRSAAANADQKGTVDVDKLVIRSLLVGRGTSLKRFRPRAKGSASPILKRTSNIKVVLAEK